MKKALVAALAVVVLVVAGGAAIPVVERYAAARIKAEIEADGTTQVAAVEVGLLDRSVRLTDLRSRRVGEVSFQRWQASGLAWPFDQLVRGRTPISGWRLGDPLQADRVELENLSIADDNGARWRVGSLILEGFDLAPYDGAIGPGPNRVAALGARVLQAVSLRRLQERDVAYTAAYGNQTVRIGEFVLESVDKGKVGSFTLTDFTVTEDRAAAPLFRLADLRAKAIDFGRIIRAVSAPDWVPGMPTGRLDLGSASAHGFGGMLLTRYGVALDRITYDSERQASGALRAQTRVAGFVLAPPERGLETLQLRMVMQSMGLQEMKLEFDCQGTEDRAKGEIAIDRCALTGPELAEIDFTFRLVQADGPFWQAVDESDLSFLYGSKAALGEAKLVLADRSLLDRGLRAIATATGQPAATVRAEAAREIRRFQPAGVLITEDMTRLFDTVARFIERGGTLTVEARPNPPFGVDRLPYLTTPGPDLVDVLGLSATLSR